ncbi:MAG: hypothetical protein ACK5N8_01320 [Alphaproteobacteria bacterium]
MKKIIYFFVGGILLFYLTKYLGNESFHEELHWSKYKSKEISLFGDRVTSIEVLDSENGKDDKLLVFYDEAKKGIYCKSISNKSIYVCTPMNIKNEKISKESDIKDFLSSYNLPKSFIAHISVYDFYFLKKMTMKIKSLEEKCTNNEDCKFKTVDNYATFRYDFLKNIYDTQIKLEEI